MSDMILTCRICGLDFSMPESASLHCCPACGTQHTRPRVQGAVLEKLRRAHFLRSACDYTHAGEEYRHVLHERPEEHEALWGLVLCKYGVEYLLEERTRERRAVVHFLRRTPITEDPDFRLACSSAPADIRAAYQADADYISQIQQKALQAEALCDPCDVFLCYKASLPGGPEGTKAAEYSHALTLYHALTERGYRVFFAHESLRQAAGAAYEAQIFHALHTARVMLVICSDPEHLSTPWVQSEWSRFLERVDARENCVLIPLLYDGCNPYRLPQAFILRSIQGLSMNTLTPLEDLCARLNGILSPKKPEPPSAAAPAGKPRRRPWRAALALGIALAVMAGAWAVFGRQQEEPPVTQPPAAATEAPTALPATEPPVTQPPAAATEAPTAVPVTEPPATQPPAAATEAPTAVPVTEPPATQPPALSKANLLISTVQDPIIPVRDPTLGDGSWLTCMLNLQETGGVDFTMESITVSWYYTSNIAAVETLDQAQIAALDGGINGCVLRAGQDFVWTTKIPATLHPQTFKRFSIIVNGTDANGHELTFRHSVPVSMPNEAAARQVTQTDRTFGSYRVTTYSDNTCLITGYDGTDAALVVPGWLGDAYAVIGVGDHAFESNQHLITVTLPEGVTFIGKSAFAFCPYLSLVTLPQSLNEIGQEAFRGCRTLREVSIPGAVRSIGGMAFHSCSGLTHLNLAYALEEIGPQAFAGCTSLPAVNIPSSLKSIGSGAFADCTSLAYANLTGSTPAISADAFTGSRSVVLLVDSGSPAEEFAVTHNLRYEIPAGN